MIIEVNAKSRAFILTAISILVSISIFIGKTELGIFSKQADEIESNINKINKAVTQYLGQTKGFENLYPIRLEKMGLLDKSFGAHPEDAPSNNWTKNGYWIGAWGDSYAIGYAPVFTEVAKYLYGTYLREASVVYFPHPKVFNPRSKNWLESGQILIVFKSSSHHFRESLNPE